MYPYLMQLCLPHLIELSRTYKYVVKSFVKMKCDVLLQYKGLDNA